MDTLAIIDATAAVVARSTAKHSALYPGVPTIRILSPKQIYLQFFCGISTNKEITVIWIKVAAEPTKQEGLAILSQYLLSGMESCRRDFHGHTQLLRGGGALYNFVAGDWFVNLGTNPA